MRIVAHLPALSFLLLAALAGCPDKGPSPSDAGVADAKPDVGGQGGAAGAGEPASGKPIAAGCAADSECASGFCVDGVCCNTACDGQCFNCNQTGTVGYCTAQTSGDDLNAPTPCTSPRTCGALSTTLDVGGCRLKDAQACKSAGDCASLNCETFYVDRDGDRYGDNNTTLMLCEETGATAPGGYVTTGGDCCDSDIDAHPNSLHYGDVPDACGGWDYNCDGIIEGEVGPFKYPEVTDPATSCGVTTKGSTLLCQ